MLTKSVVGSFRWKTWMKLSVLFAVVSVACQICSEAVAEDFTDAIHAYLQQRIEAEKINGCIVVGIVDENGSSIISYGKLDNGTDQEVNGDTVFAIHSMTGTFTRLLLQDMVERGEMKPDDPVAKYLPKSVKIPTYNGKEITLRHLAAETSGLPDFVDKLNPKRADDALGDYTVEKMYAFVSGCQLTCDPGTKHFHGGVDMGLLGQAMALKAGTDYESLMVDRIFRPLKMDSTRFTLTTELKSRLASEHDESGFGYAIPCYNWGALKPVAGLYSTANDLLKFVSAFSLTPSSLTPLLGKSVATLGYASQTGEMIHTGGGGFGGRSYACFDKTRRRGVVILSTADDTGRELGNLLLESQWQSDRRPTATNINSQVYGSYAGQYRVRSDATPCKLRLWPFSHRQDITTSQSGIGIRCEGNRLFAQTVGSTASPTNELLPPIACELLPQSETRFFERLSGRPINFSRDARGNVTSLTVDYQGKVFSYEKISDRSPKAREPVKTPVIIKLDTKLLDAYAGCYEFAPNAVIPTGMKLTIRREGDKLVGQGFAWQGKVLRGDFDIYPASETTFFDKFIYSQYTFVKNRKGDATAVIRHRVGQPDCEGKKLKCD